MEVRQDVINSLSQKALQAAHAGKEKKPNELEQLKKEFSQINSPELKGVLDAISKKEEGLQTLGSLAQILSPEKLEECLGIKSDEATKGLNSDFLEKNGISPTPSTHVSSLIDSLCHSFDLFMSTIGISELFRPAEGKGEYKEKIHIFFLVIELITTLTALTFSAFGMKTAEYALLAVVGTLALLSLIYPHITRTPSELPFAENWTHKCKFGEFNAERGGRAEAIDEIAHTLRANDIIKSHPLLIGKPGVGKSETVKAFVEAIERGEYPEFSGKKVFYVDMATFLPTNKGQLGILRDAIGRHQKDIILVLDQVHLVGPTEKGSSFGHQLKTLLDSEKGFPSVIGMTSDETFYSKQSTLAQKFKPIQIESVSPEETTKVLQSALAKRSRNIITDPNALATLIDKTNKRLKGKAQQPASALQVLSRCAEQIDRSQEKKGKGKLDQMFCEVAKAKQAFKRQTNPDPIRPLLTHAYIRAKEREIREEAKRLGVEVEITPELIDKQLR